MRGRTNVTQRTGATVNGDVKNFTVAQGTISTGDFVEVVYITSANKFSDSSYLFEDIYNVHNDIFVARNGDALVLFSCANGIIEILATQTGNTGSVYQLEANLFLRVNANKTYTFAVNSTENGFDTVKTFALSGAFPYSRRVSETTVVTYNLTNTYTSSSKTSLQKVEARYLDISDHSNIILKGSSVLEYTFDTTAIEKYSSFFVVGADANGHGGTNDTFYMLTTHRTSTYARYYTMLYAFTVDSDYTKLSGTVLLQHGPSSTSDDYAYTSNFFKEENVAGIVLCHGSSGSMMYLEVYDVVNKKVLLSKGYTSVNLGSVTCLGGDKICLALYKSSKYMLLSYNTKEQAIYVGEQTKITNSTSIDPEGSAVIVKETSAIFAYPTSSSKGGGASYTTPYTITDDGIIMGTNKNMVKKYTGKQSAIGFAKSGGADGDTIQVYVPKA